MRSLTSNTLFVVKPIPATNGLPKRFRVTDPLHGETAVLLADSASLNPELTAVLDYYHQHGGSDLVREDDVTFHGTKAQDTYFTI